MKWLRGLFGGANQQNVASQTLTHKELIELTEDYLEVLKDEGASGRPSDYASTLQYVPPARKFPGKWPGMPLCGCCSVPFPIDPRECGLWVARGAGGKQSGTIVPRCAVCLTYLNREHRALHQRDRFSIPATYDKLGQEMSSKFPLDDLQRVAILRLALLRKRLGKSR